MAILTRNQLAEAANKRKGTKKLSEVVNEVKSFSRLFASEYTIFISHSHDDNIAIEELAVFFGNLGIKIYVDWIDGGMPPSTNIETAERLKKKIKGAHKFIFLATNKSIESVWCNWELGYGDAMKFIDHIAIFPISENDGLWKGREYFRIYPKIEKKYSSLDYNEDYEVIYPDGTTHNLISWLKNKPQ